ncbi:MAG: family 1 extracellular solute-binding protein [Paenibacillaceae bacterium]|nr:family 1 extracellular solute-binding protein [Paenibacillaceae bacterium]
MVAAALVLSGCGGGGGNAASDAGGTSGAGSAEPVNTQLFDKPTTLQIYQSTGSISDTEFKNLIADPVKKKWPNVTLEIVREGKDITKENLLAANQFPDLIFTDSLSLRDYLDLTLARDLNDEIKKNKLDLGVYEKRAIDEIKAYSDAGQTYALPFSLNFGVIYYNKSIFDKAGLSYPKDGMTWKDLFEMAKAVAAKDPSVKALGTSGIGRDAESLRFQLVDPKTQQATLDNEDWKYIMKLEVDLQNLPDNRKAKGGRDGFVKDQVMAMYTSYGARVGELEEAAKAGKPVDWDMVTFPVRENSKDPGMETEAHVLMISSTSKYPDQMFQIIKYLSTDDTIQTMASKSGRISSLKDDKYKQNFGQDLITLNGKNVQAIFKNKFGPNAKPSKYDPLVTKELNQALKDALAGTDINSALRSAQERANKAIAEAKASGN